ncbi:hypothetical protein WJX81_001821 [Elliptochloris bilobata]|uniref:Uncharacterized protein n=1 Tax=Elliptochloris bilobata TaxID=381761 RepID=A0AAW1RK14_9CHLO
MPRPSAQSAQREEVLVDKLRLLDYEQAFCRGREPGRQPMHYLYLASAAPAGGQAEQQGYFADLARHPNTY